MHMHSEAGERSSRESRGEGPGQGNIHTPHSVHDQSTKSSLTSTRGPRGRGPGKSVQGEETDVRESRGYADTG